MTQQQTPQPVTPPPNALSLLRPIAPPARVIEAHKEVQAFLQDVLQPGVDYGKIPGTESEVLKRPGAERICIGFGAVPRYRLIASDVDPNREVRWTKKKKLWKEGPRGTSIPDGEFVDAGTAYGFYRHHYLCEIVLPDGRVIGSSEGICSTTESKYCERPNDCENTVLKMARKRAFVGAVLEAFGLSSRFSSGKKAQQQQPVENQAGSDRDAWKMPFNKANPTQKEMITATLKKEGVDEAYWQEIANSLQGRPCGDLKQVLIDMKIIRPT